ncbi:MAG TPA: dihydrodipicolinate reductase C-terminal domain-containing protein [Acidobacteriaceae bacterium]|nr:dihydrodipicolinate reductase C-terminal domain-containing protein [Acidobacteriaceae bacterium]
MRILVLGRGKTGKLVAEVARERGHSVNVLDAKENHNAGSLTPVTLNTFDVVIDFTTSEAVIPNLRACLASGAKVVVGTTGWYSQLDDIRALAKRKNAALLYGTNFSFGVQLLFRVAAMLGNEARGYHFHIDETHHAEKKDAFSGTALSLQSILKNTPFGADAAITAHREGTVAGIHRLELKGSDEHIVVEHEALSRRIFAVGAVRGAEWLVDRTGCYDFSDVFTQIH